MATALFNKQADKYAEARPSYPAELFDFIASKTPRHDLVWDVGTGSGQAAVHLAGLYKNVVGTDVSQQQLSYAQKLPNIRYVHTPGTISLSNLQANVAPPDSVDLITVAQAFHWFDLPSFYEQVQSVLRKPDGILAAWFYVEPVVGPAVDAVFWRLYNWSQPYWAPQRKIVDDRYRSLEFPFEPVEGEESTGPFEFVIEKKMDLNAFLMYIRSWSAYQTAKEKGVEMLPEEMVNDFTKAWGSNGEEVKTVNVGSSINTRISLKHFIKHVVCINYNKTRLHKKKGITMPVLFNEKTASKENLDNQFLVILAPHVQRLHQASSPPTMEAHHPCIPQRFTQAHLLHYTVEVHQTTTHHHITVSVDYQREKPK